MLVERYKEKSEIIQKSNFYKILEKICEDFNINDSEKVIKDFIKKQ